MSEPNSRIVCSKCGSNNFATQAACWQCGAALSGSAPRPTPSAPGVFAPPAPAPTSSQPFVAAAAMGLLFPLIAVPVGIVFLMLDDPRKAAIGRSNIAWGVAGTILHTVATGLLLQPLVSYTLTKGLGQMMEIQKSAGQQNDVDGAGRILQGQ